MKQLLFIFFLMSVFQVSAQHWGRNTVSDFVSEALDVEIDASGNVYTTGYITGPTAFDVSVVQSSVSGNGDIYVAKYDQSGTLIWVEQFGGSFSDRAYDLSIDLLGNILVTGHFYGSVNFGSTTLVSSSNSKDIFVVKLSPTGAVLWAIQEGGSGSENAYGITTDNQNNVILTGQFEGISTIAGSTFTSSVDPITNLSSYDLFISKYDSNGTPIWVRNGSADYEDRGLAVHTDANNNIFMTGQFSATLQFAGQTINNNAFNVGFLAKISPAGQLQWLNTLKAGFVVPYDVEVNGNNEAMVIGDFLGTLQYTDVNGINTISNPYAKQVFAIKTNNAGVYQWNQTLGSDNPISARSVAIDNSQGIYVTGHFSCGLSQLRTPGSAIFNSVGFKDAYLWKVGNNGNSLFVKQFGGKKDDTGHGVAVQNNGDPIVCGSYTENLIVPGNASGNYFVAGDDFNFHSGMASEPNYFHLFGDQSLNSFVTNAVYSGTPTYNFFNNQPNDSLIGNIVPDLDTVHFCNSGDILYDAHTYSFMGPRYIYSWNTGQTSAGFWVSSTGEYSVLVEREDGCSSGDDTIQVFIETPPALPTMTDNLGLAVNEPGSNYYRYVLCAPDSVEIWFNGLDPTNEIEVIHNSIVITSDTLPHYYDQNGNYTVLISDSMCSNYGFFAIQLEYPDPPDIIPVIEMVNETHSGYTDSVTICEGDTVYFHVLDSLENPNSIFSQLPSDNVLNYGWLSPNMSDFIVEEGYTLAMVPSNTGWYTLTHFGVFGYDNSCGIDTVQIYTLDSFYIEVIPLPPLTPITVEGDSLICPNGSVYLSVSSPPPPGSSWFGAGINWVSPNADSILVSMAGTFYLEGLITDSLTGCSRPFSYNTTIYDKVPPLILMDPADGIICPNDSVHMWVDDVYISYDWSGPSGSNLSTTFEHWDDDAGFYSVSVVDSEACLLTSPPVEIIEYETPFLATEPTAIICEDEYVNLLAIFQGNAQVNWTTPIVSNSSVISTNQPAWYFCEIEQCGITTYDSIQLIDGSFSVNLSISDTLLCHGDSAVVSAPPGLGSYEWSSGEVGVSLINVDAAGNYSATVMNNYGCMQQSDTLTVSIVPGSEPPTISDIIACVGDTVVIQNPAPIPTDWYMADTSFISTGFELVLNNQTANSTVLASYNTSGSCPANYDEVQITIHDVPAGFEIMGDTILCPEESSSFWITPVAPTALDVEWYINGNLVGNSNSIQFPSGTFNDGDTLTAAISNACFTSLLHQEITVATSPILAYGTDSVFVCFEDDLSLEITQTYPSVHWLSNSGTSTGQQLNLSNITNSEVIYVYIADTNGCMSNTDSIYVNTAQGGVFIDSNFGTACEGDSINLLAVSVLDSISWSTPIGTILDTTFTVLASNSIEGMYAVYAYDTLGCVYADSLHLTVYQKPFFTIPDDTILCSSSYLHFEYLPDTNNYLWNGSSVSDSMFVGMNQWLTLEAYSQQGCEWVDSMYIETFNCEGVLPNVFTPNGDGINDFFVIQSLPIFPNNSLVILNRWGNVIFDVDHYDNTFNAEGVSDGTYFYYFYPYGREHPESAKHGFVTILRDAN